MCIDVMLGSSLSSISQVIAGKTDGSPAKTILLISGAAMTFVVSLYISMMARRNLNRLEKNEHRRCSIIMRQSQIGVLADTSSDSYGDEHGLPEPEFSLEHVSIVPEASRQVRVKRFQPHHSSAVYSIE